MPRRSGVAVESLRAMVAEGKTHAEIGKAVGLHPNSVSKMLKGRAATVARPKAKPVANVTHADVVARLDAGEKLSDISWDLGFRTPLSMMAVFAKKDTLPDLAEARRLIAAGERPMAVGFRLRCQPQRLASLLRQDDLARHIASVAADRARPKVVTPEGMKATSGTVSDRDKEWASACFALLDMDAALAVVARVRGSPRA